MPIGTLTFEMSEMDEARLETAVRKGGEVTMTAKGGTFETSDGPIKVNAKIVLVRKNMPRKRKARK